MSRLCIAIVCACLVMPAASADAETRALLVGVAAYGHLDESQHLSAPRNDVAEMRELLIRRGIKRENITVLTDPNKRPERMTNAERAKLPSRRNILAALETLTAASKRGDFAIVYMSGHGSFQPDQPDGDPDHDEEDGFDEVFLPYDVEVSSPDGSATIIKNGIIDDELGKFAAAIRDKGVDLWFTLDSCHSGTGMRASGEARPKFVDPAVLGVRAERDLTRKATVSFADRPRSDTAARSTQRRGKAAFLYASQADEKAAELPLPLSVPRSKATWRSAFTHALVVALSRQADQSYRELIAETNQLMREMAGRHITQTAGYDGDLVGERVTGAGGPIAEPAQWPLYDGDRIAAGILHGLERGSIVALFVDPRAADTNAKGHAEVYEVTAAEAVLRPIREYPCPFVSGTPQCRDGGSDILDGARYARLVAAPRDYTVVVSSPRRSNGASVQRETLAARLHAALTASGQEQASLRSRLRFDDANPDLVWWVTPDGFRFAPAGIDPARLRTGAGVEIADHIAFDEARSDARRTIERAYRVERLRRLAAAPGSADADQLRVELSINARTDLTRSADCPTGSGAKVETADGPRAQSCSQVMVRITNAGEASRYVHVFMIDNDWNIRPIMNRETNIRMGCTADTAGTGAILAARATRDCEVIRYGRAGGTDDPNVADVSGYSLLVLSTPVRPGMSPPAFDTISDLNNAPGTARGPAGGFTFDNELTGEAGTRRGVPAGALPTITIVDWQLDQSRK